MKLCIDCECYQPNPHSHARYGKCTRNDCISPVDGSVVSIEDLPYCSVERKNYEALDTCGIEAKYFVAKEIANV